MTDHREWGVLSALVLALMACDAVLPAPGAETDGRLVPGATDAARGERRAGAMRSEPPEEAPPPGPEREAGQARAVADEAVEASAPPLGEEAPVADAGPNEADASPGHEAPPPEEGVEAPGLWVDVAPRCVNPCTLTAHGTGFVSVAWSADGYGLGHGEGEAHRLDWRFGVLGARQVRAEGLDADGTTVVAAEIRTVVTPGRIECASFEGDEEESVPFQEAAPGRPAAVHLFEWRVPAAFTRRVGFDGEPGHAADHEGLDLVHADPAVPRVEVRAAARGVVVHVRRGCPQSATFEPNEAGRFCGGGWGNAVVVAHGSGVYSRYAHLEPGSIRVAAGDPVDAGRVFARMGNSGRSELRHLHFEIGVAEAAPDSCGPSPAFDTVFDPSLLWD